MVIMNGTDIVERPVRLGRWVLMVAWCMVLLAAATPGAAEEIVVRLDPASASVLEAAAREPVEAVIWHGERKPVVAAVHRAGPGQPEWVVHHPWQHGHQLVLRSRAAVSLPVDIDVFQGVIDGQVAVGFWPPCEGAVPAPCSPAGITVHLATGTDWTDELVHPAGEWLLLPKGVFRYWLEAPGQVSAPPSYMAFGPASGSRGLAIVSRPLVPAGQVVLAPGHAETPDPVVQFLDVSTGFQRWVTGEGLHRPVQLPAGEVVALLGDFAHRRLTAVSRPRELSPGGLTVVDPTPPEPPDSDLVALVTNTSAPFDPESEIHISFTPPEGAPIPPDVTVVEHTTLLAIWYGRRERRGNVVVAPAGLTRAEADVTLPPGAMESVVLRVRALPSLEVVLNLPEGFPREDLRLELLAGGEVTVRREVHAPDLPVRFAEVPAERVRVRLVARPWEIAREVDMSSGEDRTVVLAPRPIRVWGVVSRCDEGARGGVSFLAGEAEDQWVTFPIGDEGRYEGLLFRPVGMARVEVAEAAGFLELLSEPVIADREVNFVLPCNDFTVHVIERASGSPVPDAVVVMTNQGEENGKGSNQLLHGDRHGKAKLPPLRPGRLELTVRAPGFETATLSRTVTPADGEVTLEVPLDRSRSAAILRLELPDGSPADGAEVAGYCPQRDAILWDGRTDGAGEVELPPLAGNALLLLARHPRGGARPFSWPDDPGGSTVVVRLPPMGPLRTLQVVGGDGEPCRWARVVLWVAGHRLSPGPVSWLTRTPGTDHLGRWSATGLPADTLEVVAWRPDPVLDRRGAAGEFDSQRTPWDVAAATVLRIRAAGE